MMKIKLIIGIAAAVSAFSAGYAYSSALSGAVISDMLVDATERNLQSLQDARVFEAMEEDYTNTVATLHALENREIEVVERLVTNEVIQYVQTDNANDCGVSSAGVRIHDIAATGIVPEVPDAASTADATAEGVTNGELIHVVSENYGACRGNAQQLAALQSWLVDVSTRASTVPL